MFAKLVFLAAAAATLAPAASDKGWDDAEQQQWAAACEDWDDWDKAGPPFRIYGNSYYVGTCGITAILITDDEGHVLIDGGTRAGAEVIAANIEKLGFRLSDVKLLLMSHEHHDHVGGLAELQRRTGARLLASAAAAPVIASGFPSDDDPQKNVLEGFEAARVDGLVEQGEPVRLGPLAFVPVSTAGHTSGALSWQWLSCAESICAMIVYADSLSPVSSEGYRFSDHPEYLAAFRDSIGKIGRLGCTILLTPHPSASEMRKRLGFGSPFGEPSCKAYARSLDERLDKRLADEAGQ